MKKFLSILLTAMLTLGIATSLCSCGNNNDGNIDNNGTLQSDDKNDGGNVIDDVEDKMTDDKTDATTNNGTNETTNNGTTGTTNNGATGETGTGTGTATDENK